MTNQKNDAYQARIVDALNSETAKTTSNVSKRLSEARNDALSQSKKHSLVLAVELFISERRFVIATIATAVLSVSLLLNQPQELEPLPNLAINEEIAIDEVAMLNELDFVNWLSEQEQDTPL